MEIVMTRRKIYGPTRVARVVATDEHSKIRVYISVRTDRGLVNSELDTLKKALVERAFDSIKGLPYCQFSIANAKQVNAQVFEQQA